MASRSAAAAATPAMSAMPSSPPPELELVRGVTVGAGVGAGDGAGVGAGIGAGVGAQPPCTCLTPHDVDSHGVPENAP